MLHQSGFYGYTQSCKVLLYAFFMRAFPNLGSTAWCREQCLVPLHCPKGCKQHPATELSTHDHGAGGSCALTPSFGVSDISVALMLWKEGNIQVKTEAIAPGAPEGSGKHRKSSPCISWATSFSNAWYLMFTHDPVPCMLPVVVSLYQSVHLYTFLVLVLQ